MTEKEKKAIEMLERFITEHKLYNIKQSDGLEDNIKIILNLIDTYEETFNDYEHELARKEEEIEELKKHFKMATRIIEGYADEVEKDTLKIENYRHKNIK